MLVVVVGEIHRDAVFAAAHMVSYSMYFYQLHISPLTLSTVEEAGLKSSSE